MNKFTLIVFIVLYITTTVFSFSPESLTSYTELRKLVIETFDENISTSLLIALEDEKQTNNQFPVFVNNLTSYLKHTGKNADLQLVFSKTGRYTIIQDFESQFLNCKRNILIYKPADYHLSNQNYPVLYMHDGNNLFDPNTAFMGNEWEVDETAEALMENNIIQKILIVGIYNTPERMEEYTPTKDSKGRGGKGPEYAQFIVKELKPFIDSTFKTLKNKQNTAVMGSSLGGLISLYIGWKYSNIFGMTGAVSPSIWWNNRNLLNEIKKSSFDTNCKIWMCMGTKEGNETTSSGIKTSLQNTRDMAVILKEKGFISGKNFAYFEAKNEGHNENAWKKRLHIPLKFFFKTNINK